MNTPKPPPQDFLARLGILPLQSDAAKDIILNNSSPILRHRIQMLSSGNDWLHGVTWNKTEVPHLLSALTEAQGIESEVLLGYRCCDVETYLAIIEVHLLPRSGSDPLYMNMALCVDDISFELQWLIQELTTSLPAGGKLYSSLEAAKTALEMELSKNDAPGSDDAGSEDDYWGQYDAQDPDREETQEVSATNDEDYYSRYGTEVDTAIASQEPEVIPPEISSSHGPLELHVRQSVQSLRQLCHASGMPDETFRSLIAQIMQQG